MTEITNALKRAQAGDADAYGLVVSAFQARLRSFIAGYVPRPEWVDDLAQQAFVSAFQSLRGFEAGTDFYAWLRSIAYNHLRAELERVNRRRRLEREYLVAVSAGELARRLDQDEKDGGAIDVLRECLRKLSGPARELIQRYYGDDLPLDEIASNLGRKPQTLKVTLFKIRVRLKECMERNRVAADGRMS